MEFDVAVEHFAVFGPSSKFAIIPIVSGLAATGVILCYFANFSPTG
jgi:hypothetical protein